MAAVGVAITFVLELLATDVLGRWTCAESMPIPTLLEWMVLPPLVVWFVHRPLT